MKISIKESDTPIDGIVVALRYSRSPEILLGEYVAIVGPSGAGKSTLLHIVGCLDRPTSGSYFFMGDDVAGLDDHHLSQIRKTRIGFVFQSFHLLADRTALENVRLPLDYRRRNGARVPHDPREILERVGLGARIRHRPGELSGGERQRVAIARALVKRPRLILFDEPTGNLDTDTGATILDLLDSIYRDEKATLLLVTHDPRVAERAGRVLRLTDGRWHSP